jgi:hypothetical protein
MDEKHKILKINKKKNNIKTYDNIYDNVYKNNRLEKNNLHTLPIKNNLYTYDNKKIIDFNNKNINNKKIFDYSNFLSSELLKKSTTSVNESIKLIPKYSSKELEELQNNQLSTLSIPSVDKTDVTVDKTDVTVDKTDVTVDKTDVTVDKTDVTVDNKVNNYEYDSEFDNISINFGTNPPNILSPLSKSLLYENEFL